MAKKVAKKIHGPEKSMALFDFALLVPSFCRVQVCGIHQARLGGLPCSWPFPGAPTGLGANFHGKIRTSNGWVRGASMTQEPPRFLHLEATAHFCETWFTFHEGIMVSWMVHDASLLYETQFHGMMKLHNPQKCSQFWPSGMGSWWNHHQVAHHKSSSSDDVQWWSMRNFSMGISSWSTRPWPSKTITPIWRYDCLFVLRSCWFYYPALLLGIHNPWS